MGFQQIDGQSASFQPSFIAPNTMDSAAGTRSPSVPNASDTGNSLQPQGNAPSPSSTQLEKTTARVQAQLRDVGSDLSFSIDKESGKTIVKLIDPATQEVIRQIPSSEMLAIAHSLDKSLQGMLINHKV